LALDRGLRALTFRRSTANRGCSTHLIDDVPSQH
jgi:hypothetical protein